jgi:hypothetical protein
MSPPTASTGYVTTTTGTSDEQKWYFQEAGSDGWATFYYIRNAVSGEALCFVATPGTGTLRNALQMKSLPDTPTDDYKFALAKTTVDGEYFIIPKPLAQYAKQVMPPSGARILAPFRPNTTGQIRKSNGKSLKRRTMLPRQ